MIDDTMHHIPTSRGYLPIPTGLVLTSTVSVPQFGNYNITLYIPLIPLDELLTHVRVNYCGHHKTYQLLQNLYQHLPAPQGSGFWDGIGVGLAVRPRKGVRRGKVWSEGSLSRLKPKHFEHILYTIDLSPPDVTIVTRTSTTQLPNLIR